MAGVDEVPGDDDAYDVEAHHDPPGREQGKIRPAACTPERIEVVEDDPDGLAETHGGDAEIVALQLEGELPDEDRDDPRRQSPSQNGHGEGQVQAGRENGGDISADGHEAAVAKGEKTREPGQDAKPQHGDQVDADKNRDSLNVAIIHAWLLGLVFCVLAHDSRGPDDEHQDENAEREKVPILGRQVARYEGLDEGQEK